MTQTAHYTEQSFYFMGKAYSLSLHSDKVFPMKQKSEVYRFFPQKAVHSVLLFYNIRYLYITLVYLMVKFFLISFFLSVVVRFFPRTVITAVYFPFATGSTDSFIGWVLCVFPCP